MYPRAPDGVSAWRAGESMVPGQPATATTSTEVRVVSPAGVRLTKFSTFAPALLACAVLAASAQAAQSPTIKVLSGRADLASGGDALVAIELPPGVSESRVRVTVGGRNVTGRFAKRANGRYEGLLTGLPHGPNVLTAPVPAP